MRALPWILGGGAVVAASLYYWRRDQHAAPPGADSEPQASAQPDSRSSSKDAPSASKVSAVSSPLPGRWVWPVGSWGSRKPEISSGWGTPRRVKDKTIPHAGVDIMFRRQPGDPYLAGTPNASKIFVVPNNRLVLAASDGVVRTARDTPRGWTVILDHAPRELATYYTHMSALQVSAGQRVTAGQPLGVIGGDPLDARHLMHLHFELWLRGDRIDPQALMKTWEFVPDPGDASRTLVARNAVGRHPVRDRSRMHRRR